MKKPIQVISAFAVLLAITVGVAACGGGSSSSDTSAESTEATPTAEETSSAAGESSEGAAGPGKAAAEKVVEEAADIKALKYPKPPAEPYDPGTGKIAVITCGTVGAQGCVEMGNEAIAAAKAAGWEPTELLDGEFNPSVESGLIQQQLTENVDAIVLISIEPEPVAAAIEAAAKAGVPVAGVFLEPAKGFPEEGGPVTFVRSDPFKEGEVMAAYVAANSEGPTRVDIVTDASTFVSVGMNKTGFEEASERFCPECEVHYTPSPASEAAKPGPPAFAGLLSSNPMGSLEWVTSLSDPLGEPALKTAEQQGRTDIKWIGNQDGPAMVESIAEGGIVQATTTVAFRYAAWAGVDEAIRQVRGLKPWDANTLPTGLLTPENIELGTQYLPKYFGTPGFDYEAMFEELWSGK